VDLRHEDDEGGCDSWTGRNEGGGRYLDGLTWWPKCWGRSCLRRRRCGGRQWHWGNHRRGSGKGDARMVSSKSSSSDQLELLLSSNTGAGV
jgi:hypothetical protein